MFGAVRSASASWALRYGPWYFLLIAAACSLGTLLPLAYLVVRAAEADWSELAELVLRERTLTLLDNTVRLAFGVIVTVTALALPAAWLTVLSRLWGRRLLTVLLVAPLAIPAYLMAFAVLSAGGPYGSAVHLTGFKLPVLRGYWGALIALSAYLFPYMYLNLRASMLRLDPSLEEAAASLGAGRVRVLTRVIGPQLFPGFCAGALLVGLHVIGDFGVVSLMNCETFSFAIYTQYNSAFDRTYAACLALLLLLLAGSLVFVESLALRGMRLQRIGSGTQRRVCAARLGWGALPAYIFLGGIICLGVVVPLGTILYWLFQNPVAGVAPELWPALRHSVLASVPAAVLAVLLAMPMAFLAVRHRSLGSRFFERSAYIGYAIPPLAFALGLMFFSLRLAPFLYQSLWLLVAGYTLHYLAEALAPVQSAVLSARQRLEEESRSLGHGPLATFRRVTFPLIRGGAVVGAAFVFLSCVKDLPLTMLLRPTGFDTLAFNVWYNTGEAMFAEAAPYALTIVLFSSLFVGLLLFRVHEDE